MSGSNYEKSYKVSELHSYQKKAFGEQLLCSPQLKVEQSDINDDIID